MFAFVLPGFRPKEIGGHPPINSPLRAHILCSVPGHMFQQCVWVCTGLCTCNLGAACNLWDCVYAQHEAGVLATHGNLGACASMFYRLQLHQPVQTPKDCRNICIGTLPQICRLLLVDSQDCAFHQIPVRHVHLKCLGLFFALYVHSICGVMLLSSLTHLVEEGGDVNLYASPLFFSFFFFFFF